MMDQARTSRSQLAPGAACLLALVFGAALTLSFAPSGAWWFTPYCMAGLFMLLKDRRAGTAWGIGMAFGIGWFGAGLWWLHAGLLAYSAAGPAWSLGLTAALVAWLGLFPACAAAAFAWLAAARPGTMAAGPWRWAAGAALWTLAEWARGALFGGFPWLVTGTAHASAPLGAFAPLAGALGVGFLNALVAVMLADLLPRLGKRVLHARAAALVLIALAAATLALQDVAWTRDTGRTLALRLVQTNLPQFDKFTPAGLASAARAYTHFAASSPAALTVFPETALPLAWEALPPPFLAQLKQAAQASGSAIAVGALAAAPERPGQLGDATNSVLVMLPDSPRQAYDYRYDKTRLVPLAEQVWPWSAWLSRRLSADFGALLPGEARQAPLVLGDARVAISICFEDLFDRATALRARDAELLVSVSNFAWFDGSYAAAQHLQAGQMRARETGRWLAQAANSGMTALVDPHGRVRQALPEELRGALDGEVGLFDGQTPFMVAGNAPLTGACLALLGWLYCATWCGSRPWRKASSFRATRRAWRPLPFRPIPASRR